MEIEATTTFGELDVFSQRERVAFEFAGPDKRGNWCGVARCGDNQWRAYRLTFSQVLRDLLDQMRAAPVDE